MHAHDTTVRTSDDGSGDRVVSASRLQQRGYITLHRAIIEDCGFRAAYLYARMEGLVAWSSRAPSAPTCAPSHRWMGEQLGCKRDLVMRELAALRDAGYLSWERTKDSANVYTLLSGRLADPIVQIDTPVDHIDTPYRSDRHPLSITSTQAITSLANPDLANETRARKNGSTNGSTGRAKASGSEWADPYWTPERRERFDRFWKAWPRGRGSMSMAARALRLALGTDFDAVGPDGKALPGSTLEQVRNAMVEDIAEWRARNEPQYVPHMTTWINQRRWER